MLNANNYCAIWIRGAAWDNNTKLYYLMTHKVPLLCVVRDPISLLKPYVNHLRFSECVNSAVRKINLTFDYDSIMPPIIYNMGERPCIKELERYADGNHNVLDKRIELFGQNGLKDVRYLPFSAISLENSFDTFCTLADQLGFKKPKNRGIFETKSNGNDRHFYFPFSLFLHPNDIQDIYKIGSKVCRNEESLSNLESIEVIVTLSNDARFFGNKDYTNITARVFGSKKYELVYQVVLYVGSNVVIDSLLFEALGEYMRGYMQTLENKERKEQELKITEKDILVYFLENHTMRKVYKRVFDADYKHIKSHRPDIVASWKYYQEFERMCEGELQGR